MQPQTQDGVPRVGVAPPVVLDGLPSERSAELATLERDGRKPMVQRLERRQAPQTISWFYDLYTRGLLDLDPPYQRRSVWNIAYRQFFVETILLHYPAPAVFLYEDIKPDGSALYSVVDGKQRLTTLFGFVDGSFPIADNSILERYQGKYFGQLDDQ